MTDQAGMRAIGAAIDQLPGNPYPPAAFRWGEVLRLRVGPYRIMYTVAATALLPLSHALTGGLHPYAPVGWFAAILGVSALLVLVALSIPTRRALRTRPVEAIGIRE